jgi:molybdate transport system substrate-binding protein
MATIRFLCSTALKSSLDELLSTFEHAVEPSYGPSAQLTKRLADGEAADAVVLTGPGFDEMAKLGKVMTRQPADHRAFRDHGRGEARDAPP